MLAGVRKNALMVLTHLILNDMMKVKGHIASMAKCLQDPEPRIAALAHLFFEELSHRVTKARAQCFAKLSESRSINRPNKAGSRSRDG